ncbi:GNAT family N-acetyltransferase [Roseibacterium sp. SDUM158017]|uniref:GNAT family N-acetyltransferase n=1 Tax=Roseicyclus salinarum TaxID=3036773 RepID=UPI0024158EA4|nr:GNAT family N-acetyltransferase [Roseibacterium sp. SDUM158017]MDG4647030.1 GNAT family N-acetyltransferase [Roseibacterium sp. SDUM158017]
MTTIAVALADAIAATWPPAATSRVGRFSRAQGAGGGNRVSAARLTDTSGTGEGIGPDDIQAVSAAQSASGQTPLFMVFDWQAPLDEALEAEGYRVRDATDMLCAETGAIAAAPPPVCCFDIWPPLAVQEDIWAAGGIGPARLAIMHRARGRRTSIFGRIGDRPAGTAFVALDGEIAMLHALEIAASSRRRGLARTMVQAAADWGGRQGAHRFAALVTQENAAAQRLYASMGMEAAGRYHYRAK